MAHEFVQLLGVSAVTMGLAHTIARERIFTKVRERLGGDETMLGYLVSCPYCVSHWLAFVLVPLTGTYPIEVLPGLGFLASVLSWFLSSILVAVVAAFFRVIFYFVDESQMLVRREKWRKASEVRPEPEPETETETAARQARQTDAPTASAGRAALRRLRRDRLRRWLHARRHAS